MANVGTKYHAHDGKVTIERSADVEATLEQVKRLRIEGAGDAGFGKMKHAARIPAVIVEQYLNDHGVTFHEFLGDNTHGHRIMTDPKYSHWRIWEGRV